MANDYAMATKARALYSKHLSPQNYAAMLDLDTVGEVASYLKGQTRYLSVLEGVNEEAIHREFLEQRIRSIAMSEFSLLMRYVQKDKHHFYQFYLKELEMNHLIFVLRAIEAGSTHHYGQFLNELNHLMVFDVDALMVCTTYQDVLKVVADTEYRKVLGVLSSDDVDLSQVEDLLQAHYNQTMLTLIKSEESDDELLNIFIMQLELENIALIYRMKKYFNVSPQDMHARRMGPTLHISEKKIKEWVETADSDTILSDLESSYYGQFGPFDDVNHIEHYFDTIRYKTLKRLMRFSTNTDVTLFAYMSLVTLEIKNVIDVVEGVRYKIAPQEIEKLLIY